MFLRKASRGLPRACPQGASLLGCRNTNSAWIKAFVDIAMSAFCPRMLAEQRFCRRRGSSDAGLNGSHREPIYYGPQAGCRDRFSDVAEGQKRYSRVSWKEEFLG